VHDRNELEIVQKGPKTHFVNMVERFTDDVPYALVYACFYYYDLYVAYIGLNIKKSSG
jgi:hypothetical protein